MVRVCELLDRDSSVRLRCSHPQLFVSSRFGFSTRYWKDYPSPDYRCFLYMGRENNPVGDSCQAQSIDVEDFAFVVAGENLVMNVKNSNQDMKVLTLRGLYDEGMFKFRMFPGDMIILDGSHPWAVDLPYYSKAPQARMLSWCILKEGSPSSHSARVEDRCETGFPVFLPDFPRQVRFFDEMLHILPVRSRYNHDMEEIKRCKGLLKSELPENKGCPPSDQLSVSIVMERLRITPRRYRIMDISSFLEKSSNIYDVASTEFRG